MALISVKILGAEQALSDADSDLIEFVNTTIRARAFQTIGDLKRATPVDTGRARNSWTLTKVPGEFANTLEARAGTSSSLLDPPSRLEIEPLYLTNGVDYISKLNEGSSRQAPARFIESTVSKNFDLELVVYEEI